MHCELIVPGLFAGAAGARVAALELLLARGRGSGAQSRPLEAWLQDAFGLHGRPLAAGALTLLAAGEDPGEASWARADPVHLRLMRERLIVAPSAAFAIAREEADALAEALNRHFEGLLLLKVIDAHRWCAQLQDDMAFDASSPLEAAGRDADLARTAGEAGRRWGQLLNEAQMLLHAHPVNQARESRGEPMVNSLWLWGTGSVPRGVKGPWQSVSAAEPIALGLARLAGARMRSLPPSAGEWLEQRPVEGQHLVVLDGLRAPLALGQEAEYRECIGALEKHWFAPLLAALRAGRVGMITAHVPEAGASFETIRGDLRRFWRRRRALERYA
ncbi:MAG TPA: hypothetical protein VFB53_00130 [Burkholderiales bacterium]|nr:hypothetical protein [Burkholderiales bacterium]